MPDADDDRNQREHRFRGLYQANFRPIQAYAARRVWVHDDAADVVAEVFTIAWRRLAYTSRFARQSQPLRSAI